MLFPAGEDRPLLRLPYNRDLHMFLCVLHSAAFGDGERLSSRRLDVVGCRRLGRGVVDWEYGNYDDGCA
jgi:hypothetical protein